MFRSSHAKRVKHLITEKENHSACNFITSLFTIYNILNLFQVRQFFPVENAKTANKYTLNTPICIMTNFNVNYAINIS